MDETFGQENFIFSKISLHSQRKFEPCSGSEYLRSLFQLAAKPKTLENTALNLLFDELELHLHKDRLY